MSVSLGSSKRNRRVETTLLGTPVILERIGTDGDQQKARQLFLDLDGRVDALGLAGADLGMTVNGRRYPLKSLEPLVAGLRTPVADGSMLRQVIERRLIRRAEPLLPPISPRRALVTTAVDHYDTVMSLHDAGFALLLGDLGFIFGLPVAIHTITALHMSARVLLPWICQMPFETLTPARDRAPFVRAQLRRWIAWATVIGGDLPELWPVLPERLDGKVILAGSVTPDDRRALQQRGLRALVSTTPRIDGLNVGTNAIEAALVAIAGKGRPLTPSEIGAMIGDDGMPPSVEVFSQ